MCTCVGLYILLILRNRIRIYKPLARVVCHALGLGLPGSESQPLLNLAIQRSLAARYDMGLSQGFQNCAKCVDQQCMIKDMYGVKRRAVC